MKHISLFCFLFGGFTSALAQQIKIDTNYYTLPNQRRQVLKADPDDNASQRQWDQNRSAGVYKDDLFRKLREIRTWYIIAEGGLRTNGSTLNNSLYGLVSSVPQTKAAWGGLLGYTYRNAWSLETGYAYAPIHLNITISNGQSPLSFTYQNSGSGLPLRLKRRLGSGKQLANGTGFWLTAGAWLIPNGNQQMDDFRLIGYISRNRGSRIDTLRLSNTTAIENRITGLAEAGIDYTTRLSPFLEVGAYIRKYWGLGNAIRSEITYTFNHTEEQRTTFMANGTGWGFGVSLRYIYSRQHELEKH